MTTRFTAAHWLRRARKRGVTLIEAVLFISIALGLIVGGLVFFQQATLAQRISEAVRTLSSMAAETRSTYSSVADFENLEEGVLIAAGAVPASLGIDTNNDGRDDELRHEWGDAIDVTASGSRAGTPAGRIPPNPGDAANGGNAAFENLELVPNDEAFEITYLGIPRAACVRLAPFDENGSGIVGSDILAVGVNINESAEGNNLQNADNPGRAAYLTDGVGYFQMARADTRDLADGTYNLGITPSEATVICNDTGTNNGNDVTWLFSR